MASSSRLILSALPPADTVVRMAERPAHNVDLSKLAPLERSVLEKASGAASIGAIVRDASLERSAALRACYALLTLGLLEIAEAEEDVERDRASKPVEAEPVEAELVQEVPAEAELADEASPEEDADRGARRNRIEQLERDAKLHLQVKRMGRSDLSLARARRARAGERNLSDDARPGDAMPPESREERRKSIFFRR